MARRRTAAVAMSNSKMFMAQWSAATMFAKLKVSVSAVKSDCVIRLALPLISVNSASD
jgi:hypothetical protein